MKNYYFDNAATSYPKPASVYNAVHEAMIIAGGNPGRSAHELSKKASLLIYETRELLCEFFDYDHAERIIFTPSATFALNTAIHSLIGSGGTFLISDIEHNATLRPIIKKAKSENAEVHVFKTYENSEQTLDSFKSSIPEKCRGVIINAASNINGRTLPIYEIGKVCKQLGLPYVIDASQLAGHEQISFEKASCDFLCCAAHKGLFAPMGCGFMILNDSSVSCEPLIYGGNGINSLSFDMGSEAPERFEAGTPPVALIAGLKAGVEFINKVGISAIKESAMQQKKYLENRICECEKYKVYSSEGSVPVISISHKLKNCERVCEELSVRGFSARGGLHCAPLAHRTIGTEDIGTVRISSGYFNTKQDIDRLIDALRAI